MNLVERWFAELTNRKLRRSAHRSVISSKPTSASGSANGTKTPSHSCGPNPPTRSWKPSPPTVNELTTQDTRVCRWPGLTPGIPDALAAPVLRQQAGQPRPSLPSGRYIAAGPALKYGRLFELSALGRVDADEHASVPGAWTLICGAGSGARLPRTR